MKKELKVGDTVKIISKTDAGDGTIKELIPIGTICTVKEVCRNHVSGKLYYGVTQDNHDYPYYYLRDELEAGHLEWVKD